MRGREKREDCHGTSLAFAHLHRAPCNTYHQSLAGCLISVVGCSLGFFHSFNDAGIGIGGIDRPLDKAILVCALDNAVLEDEAIKPRETAQAGLLPMPPQTNPFGLLITTRAPG